MTSHTDLVRAAHKLLTKSLELRRHQNLLVFCDPGSLDVVDLIADTAHQSGILTTAVYVPIASQVRFDYQESLPLPIESAIREVDAVLNLLSGSAETLAYRRRVLQTSWGRRMKVAHCPGMTLDMLAMVDVDYDLIRARCNLLATALALGKRIEVTTRDSAGAEHKLDVEIGGWEFPPSIGDGLIPEGAWANLPPGEAFTIPLETHGSIVINGSLPGRVLQPGEELILSFRSGRLHAIWPEHSPAVDHLQKTQIDVAVKHGDQNWSNLAEIGFGVNPVIDHLTGIPLVDEKKDGTVHIALGDSNSLGGRVNSTIHCDLTIERATVQIDGKPLLEAGQWTAELADFLPDYRTGAAPDEWWRSVRKIRRSGVRTERLGDQIIRYWNAGPGRSDQLSVGTPQTAQMAAQLYAALPEHRESLSREKLLAVAHETHLNEASTASLLWVMCQYDLVRVLGE
jgi:leucyl aminopeptidase (aminopeptidase T)